MDTVTCPRCAGFPRAFAHFKHVNDGLCLLCNGALVVSARVASEDIASGRSAKPQPGKVIDLSGFGRTRIERDRAGDAGPRRGFIAHIWSDVGELPVWFSVAGDKVRIDFICDGLRSRRDEIAAALQRAHNRAMEDRFLRAEVAA